MTNGVTGNTGAEVVDEGTSLTKGTRQMINDNARKMLGVGLAAMVLAGTTALVGQRALAGETKTLDAQEEAQARPRTPRQPGAAPGEPPFGGPGDFQGPGGPRGFGGPGGLGAPGGPGGPPLLGGPTMTATTQAVYILRGNQLLAYDAKSLNLIKSVELPHPEMGPGGPEGARGPRRPGERDE